MRRPRLSLDGVRMPADGSRAENRVDFRFLYVLIERQSRGAVPAIGDPDERVCAPSDSERLMSFSDSPGSSAVR
jgi:hypothetical protein